MRLVRAAALQSRRFGFEFGFEPWEKIRGCQPRVILRGAQRKGAPQVVREWNAKVAELQGSLLVKR